MNTNKVILSAVLGLVILSSSAFAQQKGAERLTSTPSQPAPSAEASVSNTKNHNTILQSHIKSLGTIGRSNRYEVNSVKVRDLFGPQVAAVLVYDSQEDTLLVVGPASAPGFGVALVNAGSTVGGSFLFGHSLRPDSTTVNNGSSSSSEGGSASASARGGSSRSSAGSTSVSGATSSSDSSASARNNNRNDNSNVNVNSNTQSQTANGGQGGNGGTGGNGGNGQGGGHTPPGHQPGHGQPGHGND